MELRHDRKPKDRDFVQTREGMFFCVTDYLHPPGRYTAYLKYSPDEGGKWRDGRAAYRREMEYYHVRNVADVLSFLERAYPQYVHDCAVRDIRFSMVPQEYVAKYFCPERRLAEILDSPQDSLEEEVCDLLSYLSSLTGLDRSVFGLTGSLLTETHNPRFSDIDLLVYGYENATRLRRYLKAGSAAEFHRPTPDQMERWSQQVSWRYPLTLDESRYLARRRWNYGYFGGRYVSIHAIRRDEEITEAYGDRIYRGQGSARVRATVSEVKGSLFLPAVYGVGDVKVLEGEADASRICEIVTYEGLFCDAVDNGDVVEAHGKVEQVNGTVQRLVVGTTDLVQGYLRPASDQALWETIRGG